MAFLEIFISAQEEKTQTICQQYWELTGEGKWRKFLHLRDKLANVYGLSPIAITDLVRQNCHAIVHCSTCQEPIYLKIRKDFTHVYEWGQSEDVECASCTAERRKAISLLKPINPHCSALRSYLYALSLRFTHVFSKVSLSEMIHEEVVEQLVEPGEYQTACEYFRQAEFDFVICFENLTPWFAVDCEEEGPEEESHRAFKRTLLEHTHRYYFVFPKDAASLLGDNYWDIVIESMSGQEGAK